MPYSAGAPWLLCRGIFQRPPNLGVRSGRHPGAVVSYADRIQSAQQILVEGDGHLCGILVEAVPYRLRQREDRLLDRRHPLEVVGPDFDGDRFHEATKPGWAGEGAGTTPRRESNSRERELWTAGSALPRCSDNRLRKTTSQRIVVLDDVKICSELGQSAYETPSAPHGRSAGPLIEREAPVGIEPTNSRFADCRLTTWPRRRTLKVTARAPRTQVRP